MGRMVRRKVGAGGNILKDRLKYGQLQYRPP
jgi:hypothetical protein